MVHWGFQLTGDYRFRTAAGTKIKALRIDVYTLNLRIMSFF